MAQRPVFKLPDKAEASTPCTPVYAGEAQDRGLQATAADAPAPEEGKDTGRREKGPEKKKAHLQSE